MGISTTVPAIRKSWLAGGASACHIVIDGGTWYMAGI
jgi:hypothetical protein